MSRLRKRGRSYVIRQGAGDLHARRSATMRVRQGKFGVHSMRMRRVRTLSLRLPPSSRRRRPRASWRLGCCRPTARRAGPSGSSGPIKAIEYRRAFDELCRTRGIRHSRAQPRHAWTNGFVENCRAPFAVNSGASSPAAVLHPRADHAGRP